MPLVRNSALWRSLRVNILNTQKCRIYCSVWLSSELAEQRQREEEERRRQEEELLASMSEAERIEYLKKKAEEEEMRRIELEERK